MFVIPSVLASNQSQQWNTAQWHIYWLHQCLPHYRPHYPPSGRRSLFAMPVVVSPHCPPPPLEEVLITPVVVSPHCLPPRRSLDYASSCIAPLPPPRRSLDHASSRIAPLPPPRRSLDHASSRIAPLSAPIRRNLFAGNTAMVVRTPGNVSDLSFVLVKFTWKQHNGMSPKQVLTRTPARPFTREMNSSSKNTQLKLNNMLLFLKYQIFLPTILKFFVHKFT